MKIENILPFAFPFGIGGPKMEQSVKVSLEVYIQVYMHLSLGQFMEWPIILVMKHIYNRLSYKTGVIRAPLGVRAYTSDRRSESLSLNLD